MAKKEVAVDEVEKYPDGSPIVRFPRWVYPGGKPSVNPTNKNQHDGILVNNQEELDAAFKSFGQVEGEPTKPKGW